ncbi:unnamed protein product, partial [Staurois parvus]
DFAFRGERPVINNTGLSSVSSCTLLCMALHSRAYKAVCLLKHTQSLRSKTAHCTQ